MKQFLTNDLTQFLHLSPHVCGEADLLHLAASQQIAVTPLAPVDTWCLSRHPDDVLG